MVQMLNRPQKSDLAYLYSKQDSDLNPIIFLGGFRSDMMGTKAEFLSDLCEKQKRSYLRFDYSGHGQSEGQFDDFVLSDWLQDVEDIIAYLQIKQPILVGSSMGGWLSLRYLQQYPEQVGAFIGIAAAPDFTRWMEEAMTPAQQKELKNQGDILVPNDYGEPYIITQKLIEDGQTHFKKDVQLDFDGKVRLLQGMKDTDVPWQTAEEIKQFFSKANVEIIYREQGNHSLSSPDDLVELEKAIQSVS